MRPFSDSRREMLPYYHLYANYRAIELSLSLGKEDLKALVKYIVGYGVLNLKCTSSLNRYNIQHKLVMFCAVME